MHVDQGIKKFKKTWNKENIDCESGTQKCTGPPNSLNILFSKKKFQNLNTLDFHVLNVLPEKKVYKFSTRGTQTVSRMLAVNTIQMTTDNQLSNTELIAL